ncbi:MAG: hypothetical protein ACT4PX_03030 [Actinomycetota bacterium]
MVPGALPGVVGPIPVDEVTVPLPPGLVVVVARDAGRAARRLARSLGADRPRPAGDALEELGRRRGAELEPYRRRAEGCRLEAAEAATALEAARAALPPGLAGADPRLVRRLAGALASARSSVQTARAALGPRPELDRDAAREAHLAAEALEEARRRRGAGLPDAFSLLTLANAGAGALVVGRLLSEAFDPAFFLVAALPLAALAYTASVVIGDVRRCQAAARRRWTALRSLDLCTMAGLAAVEARDAEWSARAGRLARAQARRAAADRAWRGVVGPAVLADDAPRAVAELERVAGLEARCRAAGEAWRDAAAALQQAEDSAGAGQPPLVVLDASLAGDAALPVLARLADRAGRATVVVVRPAVAMAPPRPAGRDPGTVPGAAVPPLPPVPAVVDMRERVLAGLQRLRSRHPRSEGEPPGPVAAGG